MQCDAQIRRQAGELRAARRVAATASRLAVTAASTLLGHHDLEPGAQGKAQVVEVRARLG